MNSTPGVFATPFAAADVGKTVALLGLAGSTCWGFFAVSGGDDEV